MSSSPEPFFVHPSAERNSFAAACQGSARRPHHGATSRDVRARSPGVGGSRFRSASRPNRSCRLGAPSPGGPARCHRSVRESGEGVSTHESWRPRWNPIRIAVPRGFGCLPSHPVPSLHSFHVPTPPLDGLQEELRRKLQKTTVALEEANEALEELRGPYRLALAYREGLA